MSDDCSWLPSYTNSLDFSLDDIEVQLDIDHPYKEKVTQSSVCGSYKNDGILIFGGYNESSYEINKCWKYILETGEYKQLKNMPGNMRGGAVSITPDKKYVIVGPYPSDNYWIYDEDKDEWENKTKEQYPVGWEPHCCFDRNGNLHVLGGNTGKKTHYFVEWKTKKWTKLQDLPMPIIEAGLTCGPDGQLYLFGGVDANNTGNILNNMWKYNVIEKKWTEAPSMPESRCHFAFTNTGNQIVVIGGGKSYSNNANSQFTDIFIYDFDKRKWIISNKKLPQPNREFSMAFVNFEIHSFSGCRGPTRHNEHYVLRTPSTKELAIKELSKSDEEKIKEKKNVAIKKKILRTKIATEFYIIPESLKPPTIPHAIDITVYPFILKKKKPKPKKKK
eukprot:356615_1